MPTQIVVAGAVIAGSTVLVAQRVRPPELAGRWELPGGKVAPGETERDALARELAEELGLEVGEVAVGGRLGHDIPLDGMTTLTNIPQDCTGRGVADVSGTDLNWRLRHENVTETPNTPLTAEDSGSKPLKTTAQAVPQHLATGQRQETGGWWVSSCCGNEGRTPGREECRGRLSRGAAG